MAGAVIEQENGGPGPQLVAVGPMTIGELALCGAVLPPNGVAPVVDALAKLFKCPDKQAGAVGDTAPDPFGAVFDRHGVGGFVLCGLRPDLARFAPDIAPALGEGLLEFGNEIGCCYQWVSLPQKIFLIFFKKGVDKYLI